MKKHIITKLLSFAAVIFSTSASYAVNSTCFMVLYEPELPKNYKSLLK